MPRSKQIAKRTIAPDSRFNNLIIAKFINVIMKNGKKTVAQDIVYGALEILKEKKPATDMVKLFEEVMDAIRPAVEVRSRRVGGANYQVPMPVSSDRQNALAFRWLIAAAKARKSGGMRNCLASEMLDAMAGTGGAIKKKEDTHRMAEANKAFAHFARRRN
ncbi:MAG: 30S ribosomal protein S7 [Candidatus Magasanikbacteria bacterium RIFCSPLOWO2_01_FULL_43_20b]|uniref:Small ribosomal subunit protein uS7 n=1 Tax=Candidatus Magasanikbacteria bacterium RIFCSPLOWO2_12_FULL_43_12 TaxID=1798692 RepID=A0A1F6MRT7_9BACT|nr:MAG: 30S ribosomal protein S7 [Candidatus Magasanikbacteria bacterium RIFCSPHIGHO2_02_FULL_44_13]OGH71427.1 MAG: 30S ribosomal protein S7 [Candidatus Magasanikbacteria bacterium RIFCSPLOWO2_02_FULL_43_22]OGH73495.1 MAG: 30S ribosomal protein S7 [Candidatus Magasanikbacteria bacterium RIFCSPLOWO2_01_FULL_43_20b]OGH74347.1 MAG: 30S ribosomal protein S7 [Candidatus Magasanikbacteria bacterium RIFCSPLOWO2_12_FULL_43_12]